MASRFEEQCFIHVSREEIFLMNARLRMYEYFYSNKGSIYAKGLYNFTVESEDVFSPLRPFLQGNPS